MKTVERALMGAITTPVNVLKDGRDPNVLLVSTPTCPESKLAITAECGSPYI